MTPQSNPASAEEQGILSPVVSSSDSLMGIFASVDFAHLAGNHLLVYGWILSFANQVESAVLQIGDISIDLVAFCVRIRRPDVSRHFSSGPNDDHGFYALIDLHHAVPEDASLLLTVTSRSGESYDSRWSVQRHTSTLESAPEADLATLQPLVRSLPLLEAMRLRRLLSASLHAGKEIEAPSAPPSSIDFEIDLCCVLEERLLIVHGWFLDPIQELAAVQLGVGNKVLDLLKVSTPLLRLDISRSKSQRRNASSRPPGFLHAEPISAVHEAESEATVALITHTGKSFYLTRPLTWDIYDSRSALFSLLGKMDVPSAMEVVEKLLVFTNGRPELHNLRTLLEGSHDRLVEQLPSSITYASERLSCWLHLDQAISVADKGVFLAGWFHAEGNDSIKVTLHCGEASHEISQDWVRNTRRDVTTFLEVAGVQPNSHEHGFTCYVAIHTDDRPCWVSIVSESSDSQRMRLVAKDQQPSVMQSVRSLLGTFRCEHRDLRNLMDRHIGPAVEAVWASRRRSASKPSIERFGPKPVDPEVSVLVPLYGRWDFAEFQMAQFANDDRFTNVDLIYVVDDPSIYDQFLAAAPGLFGIYQVPFALAFPAANLGFAGANNFGAQFASGKFLLLMNSDVLPKYPGWITEMLQTYQSLEAPGLFGVKLIYEDGTLQHAGMAFRRHAPWGGMWVNDHPYKGHISDNFKGTHEVAAVTAACVLIEADLYRKLGGLSEDYIIGDFEDSDLCLLARRAGYRNYVALDITLYHLERQSQNQTGDAIWRANLTAYNGWLHNKRWSALIEEIASQQPLLSLTTAPTDRSVSTSTKPGLS